MAGLLDGAGGASCHLCTATESQIKSLEWVESGFWINRFVKAAHEIFSEVNEEEFEISFSSTYWYNSPINFQHQHHSSFSLTRISLCFQVVYAPNIPFGLRSHTMVDINR